MYTLVTIKSSETKGTTWISSYWTLSRKKGTLVLGTNFKLKKKKTK